MSRRLLAHALRAAAGSDRIDAAVPVSGGCINECFAATQGGDRFFVKLNTAASADAFAAEADGLTALAAAGIRVPKPLAHGATAAGAFLVLEHLALGATGDFRALGRALAHLHRVPQQEHGWHRDNFIGATPQSNAPSPDWAGFWVRERLAPQLARARRGGHRLADDALLAAVPALLRGHAPRPSLLHGDLWQGNAGFLQDGTPVVFDPAVYCGDREADLAMTELFGGFPRAFYEGHAEVEALDPEYAARRTLYNLYHVLNHLNLFGEGYLAQARRMIAALLAETS